MGLTNFPNGITSFGVPIYGGSGGRTSGGSIYGTTWFVDPTSGGDGNSGKEPGKAFKTLTKVFTMVGAWDTIFCAPGDYSGNYSTPLNSVAPFVSLIGVQATDLGLGPWMAGTAGSPIINVRARGWRISGFEFDGVSDEASVKLTTSGTSNANYTQIDNCLFTGGKYGIDWVGAPTYSKIVGSNFEDILTSAFICTDSSTDVPRRCMIYGNEFKENIAHISMNPRGFKDSTIRGNVFSLDGVTRDATVLLDTRGGGGNAIVGNYFDVTKAQYTDDAATAFIRTAATDFGAGNFCNDGAADDAISA
jgi:hypothetical protein